jgi:hypothetical protein
MRGERRLSEQQAARGMKSNIIFIMENRQPNYRVFTTYLNGMFRKKAVRRLMCARCRARHAQLYFSQPPPFFPSIMKAQPKRFVGHTYF